MIYLLRVARAMKILWALLAVVFWLGEASAETRVALVIGNSAYQNASRLPNPVNDATAIASLLRSAGFEVIDLETDLGANDMRRAVRNFGARAQNADVALVYFAGHGIEVDGSNYLVPIDAQLERDLDVEDESLSLERILKVIEPARRLRLVILDACRDNPFVKTMRRTLASRAIGRGLARVEPGTYNTLIAFAAKAGSTASDGGGPNSPFTAALLKHLITPGLDLRIAFGRVRDEVLGATASRQEPFVYGSLGGSFVSLNTESQKPDAPPAAQNAAPAAPDARIDYEFAERIGTIEAWDYFLAAHGTGYYANLARAQRAKLATPPSAADHPVNVAIAPQPAVEAPPTRPIARPMLAPAELTRLLQSELKRVGCDPGSVQGNWNDKSRRALDGFNRHSGTRFDVKVASVDALEAVRAAPSRVCPLICERGMRANGDHCIRITCAGGQVLGADGICQKRKERPKPAARAARKGGGNCLSFGGRRICQ
jgi:uncharacterized caspase-like protein